MKNQNTNIFNDLNFPNYSINAMNKRADMVAPQISKILYAQSGADPGFLRGGG